jgi:lipoprotein NlpD
MRMTRQLLVAIIAAAVLAACATNPAPVEDRALETPRERPIPARASALPAPGPRTHRVASGDTLASIASRHGIDYRDLARWNRLPPPYRIYAGQELALQPGDDSTRPVRDAAPASVVAIDTTPRPSRPAVSEPRPVDRSRMASPVASPPRQPPAVAPSDAVAPARPTSAPVVSGNAAPTAATPAAGAVVPPATAPAPTVAPPPSGATPSTAPVATLASGGVIWRWPAGGKVIGGFLGGDQTRQGVDIAGSAGSPVVAAADGTVVYSGNGLLGYGELIIVKHNSSFLSAYGHNRKRLVKEGDRVRAGQQIAEMGASGATRDMLHFEIRRNGKPVNPLEFLPAR